MGRRPFARSPTERVANIQRTSLCRTRLVRSSITDSTTGHNRDASTLKGNKSDVFTMHYHCSYEENRMYHSYEQYLANRLNPTIVTQEMNGEIARWLLFTDLQRYQWFFDGLSYSEIERLDEKNIKRYIKKVNKYNIKLSDRRKICAITKNLRSRPYNLKHLSEALDGETTVTHLTELVAIMRSVLECPIPNRNCVIGIQLQQNIVLVMKKLLFQLLREFDITDFLNASSFLGNSIKLYKECSILIIHNQSYMRHHVDSTNMCVKAITDRVNEIERDFY